MEIKIKELSFLYNLQNSEQVIFKNVNISFSSGKLYALFGASGSGKTTFLNILGGLENRYTGTIIFDDTDIRTLDMHEYRRNRVSIIYQNYNLFEDFTALENLEIAASIYGKAKYANREKLSDLLRKMGITIEDQKKRVSMLSGGEQQRVAIARSIISEAPVILADEPTGNLDYRNSEIIKRMLHSLASDMKKCVIVVTHNETFKEIADTVLFIDTKNHLIK